MKTTYNEVSGNYCPVKLRFRNSKTFGGQVADELVLEFDKDESAQFDEKNIRCCFLPVAGVGAAWFGSSLARWRYCFVWACARLRYCGARTAARVLHRMREHIPPSQRHVDRGAAVGVIRRARNLLCQRIHCRACRTCIGHKREVLNSRAEHRHASRVPERGEGAAPMPIHARHHGARRQSPSLQFKTM
jgi:hypothetical protein